MKIAFGLFLRLSFFSDKRQLISSLMHVVIFYYVLIYGAYVDHLRIPLRWFCFFFVFKLNYPTANLFSSIYFFAEAAVEQSEYVEIINHSLNNTPNRSYTLCRLYWDHFTLNDSWAAYKNNAIRKQSQYSDAGGKKTKEEGTCFHNLMPYPLT